MTKTRIQLESADSFFHRGRGLAKLADSAKPIPPSRVIAFEDAGALLRMLTEQRVLLLKQVQRAPGSIASLAKELKRDRSAVTRDVKVLADCGVLQVSERPLPGHGRQKWISPVARQIEVVARF